MKGGNETYYLGVSERQLALIADSLEFCARFDAGQYAVIPARIEVAQDYRPGPDDMAKIVKLCEELKQLAKPSRCEKMAMPWKTDTVELFSMRADILNGYFASKKSKQRAEYPFTKNHARQKIKVSQLDDGRQKDGDRLRVGRCVACEKRAVLYRTLYKPEYGRASWSGVCRSCRAHIAKKIKGKQSK